ncbi:ribophorin I [Chloropicon primus]|nr:ribophorin I [Chloropicon primus]
MASARLGKMVTGVVVVGILAGIIGAGTAQAKMIVNNLEREVGLTTDGLVIASSLDVRNEGKKPLDSFVYCPTRMVRDRTLQWAEFDEVAGKDEEEARLEWTLEEDKECMRVKLATPLKPSKSAQRTVEIFEVYTRDFVPLPGEIHQSEKQKVGFTNFDVIARDPENLEIRTQTTKFFLPSSNLEHYTKVEPTSVKGKEVVYGPYEDGKAPSNGRTTVTLVFEHPQPLLEIESVVRDITVSSWTDIEVQEHYHIKNVGPTFKDGFSRVEFSRNPASYIANDLSMTLPKHAHSLFWIDVLGNITTSKAKFETDQVTVEAVPRFPLVPGWQTHFTFGYKVPKHGFLKSGSGGAKTLVMDVLPAVKGIMIKNLTINAAVPEFSTKVTGAALTSNVFCTEQDPFRTVELGTTTKKWWFDISGRPVRTLQMSDLSNEMTELSFYVKYDFNDVMKFKEVFMIASAWLLVFLVVTLWSYSDFTLVKGKGKAKAN